MEKPKMFQVWTPRLMLGLLKPGLHPDRLAIRERLVKYIDKRGLNLTEAATLHAFENTETFKTQLEQLLTPRPGERTNLEKILALLEVIARLNGEMIKGQAALDERLAVLELQITELRAFWMTQNITPQSSASQH